MTKDRTHQLVNTLLAAMADELTALRDRLREIAAT
jgi:hypothetical protein